MSLTRLFNFKYAFQNIKKSKGILAIMLIAMPIITLFFLYNYDNNFSTPYNMSVLIGPNLIGMFIIPFILSNVLLGYVYRRNNIDFINSMPISRKKIFLTNIIVGIIYILILQFFNYLVASIYTVVVNNTTFSILMMIDAFLVMFCGYVFLFIISSLALTVSGNKFTQMVVALLILFLIPFIRIVNFESSNNTVLYLTNNDGTQQMFSIESNPVYSIPLDTLNRFFENSSILNLKAILLTIVLSIIYVILGTKLFESRKMENTGMSFKSEKIHLIIKALTLYPMVVLVNDIYKDVKISELILIILLIFIYYFVYDLITNKKIKVKVTIGTFILSFAILTIVNSSFNFINEKITKNKEIYINNISDLELELADTFYSYVSTDFNNNYIRIDNEEIQSFIFDNIESVYALKSVVYNYDINYPYTSTNMISLKVNLNNGKNVRFDAEIPTNVYIELLKKILEDENYIKNVAERCKIKNDCILDYRTIGQKKVSIKKEDEIIKLINDNLEEYIRLSIQKEINIHENNYEKSYGDELRFYSYKNHAINTLSIHIDCLPTKVLNSLAQKINNDTKNVISNIEKNEETFINPYFKFEKKGSEYITYTGNLSEEGYKKIIEYFKNDENSNFDSKKDYYIIDSDINGVKYLTNEIELIEQIIETSNLYADDYNTYNNEVTTTANENIILENVEVSENKNDF